MAEMMKNLGGMGGGAGGNMPNLNDMMKALGGMGGGGGGMPDLSEMMKSMGGMPGAEDGTMPDISKIMENINYDDMMKNMGTGTAAGVADVTDAGDPDSGEYIV